MKKLIILLLLAGCAQGPQWSAPPTVEHGKAQIVLFEPKSLRLSSTAVDLNGQHGCDVAAGGYFVLNVPPGEQTLSASIWDMPGTSRLTVNAKAGQRYYVRLDYDFGKGAAFGGLGLPGALAVEGASSHGGPFTIELIDQKTALDALPSMHAMSCQN